MTSMVEFLWDNVTDSVIWIEVVFLVNIVDAVVWGEADSVALVVVNIDDWFEAVLVVVLAQVVIKLAVDAEAVEAEVVVEVWVVEVVEVTGETVELGIWLQVDDSSSW